MTRHGAARVGGIARLRVIVLFAGVEALASADQGTVGALAPQLEHALHIGNGKLGVMAGGAALAGVAGTLPVGVLTDRINRVRLLAASIVLWSIAMVASALAPSFAAREHGARPHPEVVLRDDPVDLPLRRAIRYVLRIRTNALLIVGSGLGFLFFAGIQTFAVLLLRSRYGLSQAAASSLLVLVGLGAVVGVVFGGRLADRLLRGGMVSARVAVGAVGYLGAAAIFLPALASPLLVVSMPLFILGAAALAAPDPTLNAARLDVMHPRLWGRAESVRTVVQMGALAIGPLLFGFISAALGGPHISTGSGGAVKHTNALAYAFLIMLVPVAAGGTILLRARGTYPRDVATIKASLAAEDGD